jgi:hypothetical protein
LNTLSTRKRFASYMVNHVVGTRKTEIVKPDRQTRILSPSLDFRKKVRYHFFCHTIAHGDFSQSHVTANQIVANR